MRTTVRLDDDVAAAVEQLSRERHISMSEAVNELARAGTRAEKRRRPFKQRTAKMGPELIDVSNVAEALELIDGPDWK
jgi:predicted transcriptional regulator